MKIITIVGARPQFIKAAAVSRAFAKHSQIEEVIVHTGQHFDANMSDIFFEEMQIPRPQYNLDVNGLGHGAMTGQMLEKIEKVLLDEKPDWVLVYGDTLSGDVMQDAAMFYAAKSRKPAMDLPDEFVLATIHRAENTDDLQRLTSIFEAFDTIGETTPVVLPLHPRTLNIIKKNKLQIDDSKIKLIEPVGYLEMVYMLQNCKMVMSDSGGLQKEAFFFAKPCVTLRDETEWVELITNGFNTIVGADQEKIISAFNNQKFDLDYTMNLYGGGKAADNIAEELLNIN